MPTTQEIVYQDLQYAIISSVSVTSSSNVIINGDFETGDFTGWEPEAPFSIDAAAAHSGDYGCKLVYTLGDPYINQYDIPSNFKTISLWLKTTASSSKFYFELGNDSFYDYKDYTFSSTDGWRQFTWTKDEINVLFSLTPEMWETSFDFYPNFMGSAATIYLDDVVVAAATPYTLTYAIFASISHKIYHDCSYNIMLSYTPTTTLKYNILRIYDIQQTLTYVICEGTVHLVTPGIETITLTSTPDGSTYDLGGYVEYIEYLVVGAGGSGGMTAGGGGGGGAVHEGRINYPGFTSFTAIVGIPVYNNTGLDSQFYTIVAKGGGKGGANSNAGSNGGSGGGGACSTGTPAGGSALDPLYGHDGGTGDGTNHIGGGGGGAGEAGNTDGQGYGGDGIQADIDGQWYGGGGGGGSDAAPHHPGGDGGGGEGGWNNVAHYQGDNGAPNTGGGGGGGANSWSPAGGSGGTGVVKFKYPKPYTLTYVISEAPLIYKTLKYSIQSTYHKCEYYLVYNIVTVITPLSKSLEYIICDGLIRQQLQYTLIRSSITTKGLQYIIPHIEIVASQTSSDIIPINIEFHTTTISDVLPTWSWTWDFDDTSGSSTVAATSSILHQFLDYGEYDVTCTAATISGGASSSIHISITERVLPTPMFYYFTHVNSFTVEFYDYSTNAISYDWDFGDGTAHSSAPSPTHTYAIDDVYNVILTATNGAGSDSITKQVQFTYDPPVADFEMLNIVPGGTGTYYNVSLTVTDYLGRSDTKTQYVRVTPLEFTRFKDLSTGNIKYWEWDFGDVD